MSYDPKEYDFSALMGCTIAAIVRDEDGKGNDRLTFNLADGRQAVMWHPQDCCESVSIGEIHGDLSDLIDSPVLMAEETGENASDGESNWTFYKLATAKGYVTIRWIGTSDGYYSMSVAFYIPSVPA